MKGRLAALVVLAVVASGCSAGGQVAATSNPPSSDQSRTIGLVALGHSGLTGAASDPHRPTSDTPMNSWVTGTAAVVDSIYTRLVRADPGAEGHVYNGGIDGSTSSALVDEIPAALKAVPHPQLVIIQTIDNDITCDGNDDANVPVFGRAVAAALALIARSSPRTRVLTMSQFGRPATYTAAWSKDPGVSAAMRGSGPCNTLDPDGHVVPSHVQHLTAIIEAYEAELAKVCQASTGCTYTTVPRTYRDAITDSNEGNHQNVVGAHKWAALMWPTVAALAGLPGS